MDQNLIIIAHDHNWYNRYQSQELGEKNFIVPIHMMLKCQQRTSTNKISTCAITEVMKHSVTMVLQHLCMNVET